jgi:hypothetical protein
VPASTNAILYDAGVSDDLPRLELAARSSQVIITLHGYIVTQSRGLPASGTTKGIVNGTASKKLLWLAVRSKHG